MAPGAPRSGQRNQGHLPGTPRQQKTQRPVQFEITEQTRSALAAWIHQAKLRSEDCLFQPVASSSRSSVPINLGAMQ
ncbi:hypothetical protein APA86_33820 [Pseudomonas aeruginosa]|nr:hypothetical protein APA86_33820 [Pseudomonas aeruginosa]